MLEKSNRIHAFTQQEKPMHQRVLKKPAKCIFLIYGVSEQTHSPSTLQSMIRFISVLFLFITGIANGQSAEQRIKNIYNKVDEIELYNDSVAAKQLLLEAIAMAEKEHLNDLRMQGKWKLIAIDAYYGKDFRVMDESMKMFREETLSRHDSSMVLRFLSDALGNLGAYEMAIAYSKKSLKIYNPNDSVGKYYIYEGIARLYTKLRNFEQANKYYRIALTYADHPSRAEQMIHCLNNWGYCYFLQEDYEKSGIYYQKALDYYHTHEKRLHESIMYAVILANLGELAEKKNQPQEAIRWCKEAYVITNTFPINPVDRHVKEDVLVKLAHLELEYGSVDEAYRYLSQLTDIEITNKTKRLQYYDLLTKYYNEKGNLPRVADVLKQKEAFLNSLSGDDLNAKLNEFVRFQNNQIELDRAQQLEAQRVEQEIAQKKWWFTILIAALIVLSLIIFFVVYRKIQKDKHSLSIVENKLNEEKLKVEQSERERLQMDLDFKNKDLLTYAVNITKKHEFASDLAIRLQALRKKEEVKKTDLNELINYVKSFQAVDGSLMNFQNNVNEINQQFLERLQKKYPTLTQNEVELCVLVKLRLSSKDIATMRNITTESVNVLRSRLRKKMNLELKDDLYEVIESV